VLYKIKNQTYYLVDPVAGLVALTEPEFIRSWEDKEVKAV
jgi:hypothetical protein